MLTGRSASSTTTTTAVTPADPRARPPGGDAVAAGFMVGAFVWLGCACIVGRETRKPAPAPEGCSNARIATRLTVARRVLTVLACTESR